MKKLVKEVTARNEDFAQWYTDICLKAKLMDYSNVKGFIIYRPYSYRIWELIQAYLNDEFRKTGHENVYLPLLIPESLFQKEKDHLDGFAPEVGIVTTTGKEDLAERLIIRPTSEVLFCDHFKKIIKSYRDLPLLYNQWCTIVRWEKTTRPFLRTREILWQEGHTMHATETEAREETLQMLGIYEKFQKEFLATPVLTGLKTEKEKFAGAEQTYTIEAMMYDGVALQNGTSHYFGQGFAEAFDIKYLDKNNQLVYPYQTSWGVSTRMIGGLIMVHSDDLGLVLPPKIAPIKVAIVPIGEVDDFVNELTNELKTADISYHVDNSDKSPGFKFAEAEVKGYPIRIEVGARDLKENKVTLVRRDTLEKISVANNIKEITATVKKLLTDIQNDLYQKAETRRDSMLYQADNYEEFKELATKPGFILTSWCGNVICEDKVKDEFGLKSRCIPMNDEQSNQPCTICGAQGKYKLYFGKQY